MYVTIYSIEVNLTNIKNKVKRDVMIMVDIWSMDEVKDYTEIMRRCVEQSDIVGFNEILVRYNLLIQDYTLKFAPSMSY